MSDASEKRRPLERVIVFTRFPEVGRVKTRLAAGIGEIRACVVHDRLARHAVREARAWDAWGGGLEIRITGGTRGEWLDWLGDLNWVDQGEGTLGERLSAAVEQAFDEGVERLVVMGTDCPDLDRHVLQEAFHRLETCGVVFGPAFDGGYYLVGITTPRLDLFDGVDWGSDRVLEQSLAKVPDAVLMDPLMDIDTVEDLRQVDWPTKEDGVAW